MDTKENSDWSCDDVFIGRLTLKEVKKRIFMNVYEKNIRIAHCDGTNFNGEDVKIIETSSQPNMLTPSCVEAISVENLKSTSDPLFNRNKQQTPLKVPHASDHERRDSFLEIEKQVTEQCMSPYNCDNTNLDNTLDFVDFILNHAQSQTKEKDVTTPSVQVETHSKSNNVEQATSALNTPVSNKKGVSNFFRTPKIPRSGRKDTCSKKTPNRLKAYEHIASPIATYIRNGPQVPLVKDVHPKMPLPSTSFIPKLLKNASESKNDKENIVLPQLAYRSAKKTLVIDVNKEKLPQSHWAQKLTTFSRQPVVLKHDHREVGRKPLLLQQEDSFQDLTLHQADISVCTQKRAFNK